RAAASQERVARAERTPRRARRTLSRAQRRTPGPRAPRAPGARVRAHVEPLRRPDRARAPVLRIDFEGWFQVRLATDPDPSDEPRGVSGTTFALAGEPDFDRIVRFWEPIAP